MKKKIDVRELKLGMYISELDCPWLETPFLFQGFEIRSEQEIEDIKRYCEYVFIDDAQGHDPQETSSRKLELEMLRKTALPAGKPIYQDQLSLEQELGSAQETYSASKLLIKTILNDVRLGKSLDLAGAKQAVGRMAESVIRNPDALICLTQLKDKNEYTALHCLRVCILALTFGRHLGLEENELNRLGIGALLHDIGKMKVPNDILNKPDRLEEKEQLIMKKHVIFGAKILQGMNVPRVAVEIALSHHERYDGKGYIYGLAGKEITTYGAITSIVDCYDAITSDRVYRQGISSHQALQQMYPQRKKNFDAALIEQFIQCMGIYPIGSLVELNTGQVGVVITINRIRYLRPKLVLVLDRDKVRYGATKTVDLMRQMRDEEGRLWEIKNVLAPQTYGINPVDFLPVAAVAA